MVDIHDAAAHRNRPSPPAGGMSSRKRDALGHSIRHEYLFVRSFIYLFFNKGLKQIDGQSLLQGRKRRICRDDCFIHHRQVCTWANWIFFYFVCTCACVCTRKKKNKGMIFFFHLCSSVWAIISLHWPRRRGASNWACWRETERLGMRAGQAAICFRVRKKETKGKLPDRWE